MFINYFFHIMKVGRLVPSQRGKQQLEYQQHLYNNVRTNKDGSIYWECTRRRRRGDPDHCTVHLKTDNNLKIVTAQSGDYNHEHDAAGGDVRQVRALLLQTAKDRPEAPPTGLINELVGFRLALEMPSDNAIKRAIQRIRNKSIPRDPDTAIDIALKGQWRNTIAGDCFLFVDITIDGERVLGFLTGANFSDFIGIYKYTLIYY